MDQGDVDFQLPQAINVENRTVFNPFSPIVKKNIPLNIDNLLNVDSAALFGIADRKAILVDPSGKNWTLQRGDRVYLGTLTDIDTQNRTVEFTLNVGGFLKKVLLSMKFKNN